MANTVILNKTQSILRCIERIEEDYFDYENEFEDNFMRQDAILLNLKRACKQAIDLANYIVKIKELDVPRESKAAFDILKKENFLSEEIALNMKKMVGFRNIAVHEYYKINLEVVRSIIEKHLDDFRSFVRVSAKLI